MPYNWNQIDYMLLQLYPDFLPRLEKRAPTLTAKEIRICILVVLKIPGAEIPALLNIHSESVYKTRYRIRKKLSLPPGDSLFKFLIALT